VTPNAHRIGANGLYSCGSSPLAGTMLSTAEWLNQETACFKINPIALELPRVETGGKPGSMGFAILGS